jgi:two-component system, OmpR family, response regulator
MNISDFARVAVVEDEPGMRLNLVEFLNTCGFRATGVGDAPSLYRLMAAEHLDLVILDVRLPGESGMEVARRLRDRDDIRVLMLTAQTSDEDRVEGLNAGADAYLNKQTPLAVIDATCRSILRRTQAARRMRDAPAESAPASSPEPAVQVWQLHAPSWILSTPNGQNVKLTHAEQSFLAMLLRQPGESVSRPVILNAMGKPDTLINRRNLDSCARRIRAKVAFQTGIEIPIESSYGIGYVFQGNARCLSDNG